MQQTYDVIIIGCGFAALSLLRYLKDYNVIVFEEHDNVGVPPHCTGLISDEAIKILNPIGKEHVINSYKSFRLYSPSWKPLIIDYKRRRIHIVDRVSLDKSLYTYVADKAHFHFSERVEKVNLVNTSVVTNRNLIVKGGIIVDCEGTQHRILQYILGKNRGVKIPGLQWDIKVKLNIDPSEFIIYFSNKLSPSYFSWLLPLDTERARIGLGGYGVNMDRLRFLTFLFAKKGFIKIRGESRPFGGTIVLGPPLLQDYLGNVIFLGDAGFHTKPFTGGGVYTISLFSKALAKALNKYGITQYALKRYHKISLRLKNKLQLQYIVSRIFHSLNDREKDKLWNIFNQYNVGKVLSKGSFDFHEENAKSLLKNRLFMLNLVKAVRLKYSMVNFMKSILDLLS